MDARRVDPLASQRKMSTSLFRQKEYALKLWPEESSISNSRATREMNSHYDLRSHQFETSTHNIPHHLSPPSRYLKNIPMVHGLSTKPWR